MRPLLAVCLAIAAGMGSANAQWFGNYTKVYGGAMLPPDQDALGSEVTMDEGWNAGAAVGWDLSPNFALEAEGQYSNVRYDNAPASGPRDLTDWSLMLNGIWSLGGWNWGNQALRPYVGAGLGGVRSQFRFSTPILRYKVSDTNFAYQAMAGIASPINQSMDFLLEYRWRDTFDDPKQSGATWEDKSHNINAGLRIRY